jgi:hypothetical protein
METTINELTPYERVFFINLRNYIDKPIYFYGSIQRNDYFQGKSDVDIAIFTDNEASTIFLLENYLNLEKKEFRKSIHKLNNKIIPGYKAKYKNENENMQVEISVYNEKYKDIIMQEHSRNLVLPFYVSITLIVIKYLYYNLQIIPKKMYKDMKRLLLNENGEMKFILLDN